MKRREFLGKTVIGTAGLTVGASAFLASSCRGAGDKVVLALIGAGERGISCIINCCKTNQQVEIKLVCDVNENRSALAASEIEKQLGYKPSVARMQEVFDDRDIDAVWIATPGHWNALAAVLACKAGKDVYVETPAGNSISENRRIVQAEKRYRRIVQTGFQNRSAAFAASAREYISSGKLGQVVHIRIFNLSGGSKWLAEPDQQVPRGLDWDAWLGPAREVPYNPGRHTGWKNWWEYGPGTFNEAGHQIDLACMVMGDPGLPRSLYGWGGNNIWGSAREVPELQSVTYDFKKFTMTCESGNATGYMTPSALREDKSNDNFPDWKTCSDKIEIYGTLGFMCLGRDGGGWQVFGPGDKIIDQYEGSNPDTDHQANFIKCIRNRKPPEASPVKTCNSTTLVHLANIACRSGNKQLSFDPEKGGFNDDEAAGKLLLTTYREQYMMPVKI